MSLIDKDVLIDTIDEVDWYHINQQGELVHGASSDFGYEPLFKSEDIYDTINALVPVQQKTAVWIRSTVNDVCSGCGGRGSKAWKFCPNCGAQMIGGRDATYSEHCVRV